MRPLHKAGEYLALPPLRFANTVTIVGLSMRPLHKAGEYGDKEDAAGGECGVVVASMRPLHKAGEYP